MCSNCVLLLDEGGLAVKVVDLGVVHVAEHEGGQLELGLAIAARVQERALVGDSEVVTGQLRVQLGVIVAPALAVVVRKRLTVVVVHFSACVFILLRIR